MSGTSSGRAIAATLGIAALTAALFLLPNRWSGSDSCPVDNPRITLQAGKATLRVELATSDDARYCGLAFRDHLAPGTGMLFAYPGEQALEFWMKDTRIPLALAFIDADRRITEIHQLTPEMGERSVLSTQPVPYALETNPSWFDDNGISTGNLVNFVLPHGIEIE